MCGCGHADTDAEENGPDCETRHSRECEKKAVAEIRGEGKPKRKRTDQRNGAGENRAQYPRCQGVDVDDGYLGRDGCRAPDQEGQSRENVDGIDGRSPRSTHPADDSRDTVHGHGGALRNLAGGVKNAQHHGHAPLPGQ